MFSRFINLELSRNKQTVINIIASVLNMAVTTLISFVLSPYIVGTLGVEANGFVSLANNFISYAMLARTALNSMGSRFLMMAYYNDQHEKVQKYYSSLFFGDLFLSLAFGVISAVCIGSLEHLLNIPVSMVTDVKWLFALLFTNFIISTILTAWSVAPYIKNKLYLDSATTAVTAIVRALVIAGLFICLEPSVSFVGIGTLVSGLLGYGAHFVFKRTLFPDWRVRRENFSWLYIKELLSSGVWNSISSLGSILTNGIDLLVANLFIGPLEMGILSVAKTMPAFVSTLNETMANVFTPSLLIDYAHNEVGEIVSTMKKSSKMISAVCSIPLGFLMVFGEEFYALWQPTQDAHVLHILSVITIAARVLFTGMQPLFNVFTVVNKVKQNSIVTIANGLVSIGITAILLYTTDLGVYAIAGVSVVCCVVKNLVFVIPYSAKYLGLHWKSFYFTLVPSVVSCVVLYAWGLVEKMLIQINGWGTMFVAGVVFATVGILLTSLIVLNKRERGYLIRIMTSKLKRNRQ